MTSATARREAGKVAAEIKKIAAKCFSCKKCSAGCPVAPWADLLPHRLVRLAQEGDNLRALAASRMLWLCASCLTCSGVPLLNAPPTSMFPTSVRLPPNRFLICLMSMAYGSIGLSAEMPISSRSGISSSMLPSLWNRIGMSLSSAGANMRCILGTHISLSRSGLMRVVLLKARSSATWKKVRGYRANLSAIRA